MLEKVKTAALARAAAGGDKQAFTSLIDPYRQYMYATAMAVTHNEDDAMDMIQDTLLILWEKLPSLRDPGAFKTWMTRVLLNECYSLLRRRGREVPLEHLEEENGAEMDRETSLDVQNALSQLSESDRLLLQMFYFQDLSVKEIAKILSVGQEAVRMRLSRSRKRFKQYYESEVRYEKR